MRMIVLSGIAVLVFWAPARTCSQDRGRISGQLIRVIDDGATGDRWLLVRQASDPGGPGRMVRVESAASGSAIHPVIHAGDAVIVEEHTEVVEARLEATAVGSAVIGAEFEARLKIGGKVVRAMALGPGKAALAPKPKTQP